MEITADFVSVKKFFACLFREYWFTGCRKDNSWLRLLLFSLVFDWILIFHILLARVTRVGWCCELIPWLVTVLLVANHDMLLLGPCSLNAPAPYFLVSDHFIACVVSVIYDSYKSISIFIIPNFTVFRAASLKYQILNFCRWSLLNHTK